MKCNYLLAVPLALALGLSSCNNDDDPAPQLTTVNLGPTANFSMSMSSVAYAPVQVSFSNHSANAVSYEWDFGDGSPKSNAATAQVQHTFEEAGTFQVKLTAYGQNGTVGVKVMEVEVLPIPTQIAQLTARPYLLTAATAEFQGQTQSILPFMDACVLDNLHYFRLGYQFEIEDAGTQCNPPANSTGNWHFSPDFDVLYVNTNGLQETLTVISMSNTTLELTETDGTILYRYTYTAQ